MSHHELRRAVRAAIERMILQLSRQQGTVTADDVRRVVAIPDGIDPRIVGNAFLALKQGGWIVEIGDQHTGRPVAHSRMIRVWRLAANPARLDAWLALPVPAWDCTGDVTRPRVDMSSRGLPLRLVQRGLFDDDPETTAGGTGCPISPAV